MGFFDNLGKAISDAGNSAIQKGRDAANVAKYNRLIADEEKETAKLFEQLGRQFYEAKGDNAGEEFGEIFDAIQESKDKISGYQDMVRELQGIIQCASCGMDIPAGALFCPECGEKVPEIEKEEKPERDPSKLYCTECGAEIAPGIKFCMNCGTKVELSEVIEPEETLEDAAQEAQEAAEEVVDAADEAVEIVEEMKETLENE